MSENFDILVVGGGMVGATFACALGNTPLKIAVIEPHPADTRWPVDEYDNRVSAITRATQRVFQAVGAWQGMVERRVCAYREMHVWDATGAGEIHFDGSEIGEMDLGHIIENRVILAALLERMTAFSNIELMCPAQVADSRIDAGGVRLTLEDGRELSAALLVGADGSRSRVRDSAGITTSGWDYDQTAVVATVRTSQHHDDTAWQRFMPEGPLAFLPLPDGSSSIVWSVHPEHAVSLMELDEQRFLDALQSAFGETLGRMESCGPRGAYPLMLQHADNYVKERLALVGNAAHTVHPLAGQGLNLGVSDAAVLAEVVLDAQRRHRDIGALSTLRRYERWRRGDNMAMLAAMDGFKRLFSNDIGPLRWLRNTGLRLVDTAAPLKRLFMRHALGLEGELPHLARGEPL